jgi:hypothetical protein
MPSADVYLKVTIFSSTREEHTAFAKVPAARIRAYRTKIGDQDSQDNAIVRHLAEQVAVTNILATKNLGEYQLTRSRFQYVDPPEIKGLRPQDEHDGITVWVI